MNTTALAIIQPDELETIQRTGRMLAASGYFDAKGDSVQAIAMMATKILAGREIGIGPFAAVNGIHIIQGKPSIGANLLASAVKGSNRYDYRVREMSDKVCRIEFFQRVGDKLESLGVSEFTKEEAVKAQTKNLDKFPKNMLFARAMSNGVRWFVPDVFNGNSVYVPEELGAEVDGDGNVIDVTPRRADSVASAPSSTVAEPSQEANPFDDNSNEETLSPTDEELEVLGVWQTPDDARAWAVNVGACENEFEARNSFKKIVDAHGGKLTKSNVAVVYLDFLRRQNTKLATAPEPEFA